MSKNLIMSFLPAMENISRIQQRAYLLRSHFNSEVFGIKNIKISLKAPALLLRMADLIWCLLCWICEAGASRCNSFNFCYANDHRTRLVSDDDFRCRLTRWGPGCLSIAIYRYNRWQAWGALRSLFGYMYNRCLFDLNFLYPFYRNILLTVLHCSYEFCWPIRYRNIRRNKQLVCSP